MNFWNSKVGEEIEALAQAIENTPSSWIQGEYSFYNINNPSISIWTANGFFGFKISGQGKDSMNSKEKKRLMKSIRICLRKQIFIAAKEVLDNEME